MPVKITQAKALTKKKLALTKKKKAAVQKTVAGKLLLLKKKNMIVTENAVIRIVQPLLYSLAFRL